MTEQQAVRFKRRARVQFDGWAGQYDRSLLNHFLFRPSHLALMEEVARWRADRPRKFGLLDIGSGTGTFADVLRRSGWPVTIVGLDFSPAMCARAAAKAPAGVPFAASPRFTTGDSEHMPFAAGSFDVVTCANSFHHYPDKAGAVREMRRVLRPGGRLILIDGFRDNVLGWFIFDVVISRIEGAVYHAPWHEIHTVFAKAGLRRIRRRKLNVFFPLVATIGDA